MTDRTARPDPGSAPTIASSPAAAGSATPPKTAAAGLATLTVVDEEPVHEHTESLGGRLRDGLAEVLTDPRDDADVLGFSSLAVAFAIDGPARVPRRRQAPHRPGVLSAFHRLLYGRGYYFHLGALDNVSYAHTEALLDAAGDILDGLRAAGFV